MVYGWKDIHSPNTNKFTEWSSVRQRIHVKRDISSERLLKGRKLFSQSIMVSVAVLQLGKSSLVFVERGAKVSSSYSCDIVLHQGLLPDIRAHSGDNFTFQQDGAPVQCSSFTKNNCFSHCSHSRLYWTRKLAKVAGQSTAAAATTQAGAEPMPHP